MSQNDYYGGGGGYMQPSSGGSPFQSPGRSRTEASNSLRPFSIAQLGKATQAHNEAEWKVDETEVGQVTIVGCVNSIAKQATNHVFVIDDGSGKIEARRWVSASDDDGTDPEGVQEAQYVRVTGGLKSFGKKRYVNIAHIRPVTDPHEIYFHILEVIAVGLILERGPPGTSRPAQGQGAQDGTNNMAQYSAQSHAQNDQFSHLPALERQIMNFIKSHAAQSDEGVHVTLIARAIGGNDANKISTALDKLMDEGHVFTTIDDSHFAAA